MSIKTKNVRKWFGEPKTHVLNGIDLNIKNGEFIALTGKSGSGKSTLLYIISSLDRPSEGSVYIDGKNLSQFSEEELHRFRNQQIGFVFQFHYLLAELSALENVLMPTKKFKKYREKFNFAKHLLEQVGLGHRLHNLPSQLSGGEQQRVAIARALIMNPKYIFADEPTGSLDTQNSERVWSMLENSHKNHQTTIVAVTHDSDLAKRTSRTIELVDGKIKL